MLIHDLFVAAAVIAAALCSCRPLAASGAAPAGTPACQQPPALARPNTHQAAAPAAPAAAGVASNPLFAAAAAGLASGFAAAGGQPGAATAETVAFIEQIFTQGAQGSSSMRQRRRERPAGQQQQQGATGQHD